MSPPKVSVCMITYNQERFVAQAIESALMQRTDFPVELLIGEDCSTDRTREIVLGYARAHPGRVRPLLRERNLGRPRNSAETLKACTGEYIALLEGDDWWTSPRKLQIQVDWLDAHPDRVECFHAVPGVSGQQDVVDSFPPLPFKEEYGFDDLVSGNCIATCSTVIRRSAFASYPSWIFDFAMGDWPIHLWSARLAPIGFIPKWMGAYRVHPGSHWKSHDVAWLVRQELGFLEDFARRLEPAERARIGPQLARRREFLRGA
jgi:glycosyltransferase involved in cell wall biosynthesis